MNLYEKINKVKLSLLGDTGKSGKNKYGGYEYFELSDFMPVVTKKCDELGLFTTVSFSSESAKLAIINAEKPEEKIEISSPMSTADKLSGCNEVQKLGAVQTYLRRYLYMAAFDIIESDKIDGDNNPSQPPKPQQPQIDYTINPKSGRKFADYESGQLVELLKFFENSPRHSKYAEVVRGILVERENQENEVIEL